MVLGQEDLPGWQSTLWLRFAVLRQPIKTLINIRHPWPARVSSGTDNCSGWDLWRDGRSVYGLTMFANVHYTRERINAIERGLSDSMTRKLAPRAILREIWRLGKWGH